MLPRVITILLSLTIPLQGLAVPHYHGATDDAQPEGHNHSPHFHLGNHHHDHGHAHDHRHSHGARPADVQEEKHAEDSCSLDESAQPDDHDADAIYVWGELGLNLTKKIQAVGTDSLILWSDPVTPTGTNACSAGDLVVRSSASGDIPIFLATFSLRL